MSRGTEHDRVEEIGGFKFITLETGRRVAFHHAEREALAGKNKVWRWLSRMNKLADRDWEYLQYEWFLDDLETMLYIHRKELEKKRGRRTKEERIAALRATAGRTPDETRLYLAKADELERKLRADD